MQNIVRLKKNRFIEKYKSKYDSHMDMLSEHIMKYDQGSFVHFIIHRNIIVTNSSSHVKVLIGSHRLHKLI